LADDGIDPTMVEAAVNTIEFSLRENNTGSARAGWACSCARCAPGSTAATRIAPLAYEAPLAEVKAALAPTLATLSGSSAATCWTTPTA
jgi:Zn-dependent M16 (insulinase) family peptidase